MSGRIGKKCPCGCGCMVYFTPPMRGDKTLTEANREIQALKLDNQRMHAEIHQLQTGRGMLFKGIENLKKLASQVF